jgi:alanine racemase
MNSSSRPVWAEVDLRAIRHNVAAIRERLVGGTRYLAVVKGNGYGHGDVESAKAALDGGASWLGVVLVDEAVRLREAGIDAPILLMHEPPPERAADVLRYAVTPSVFTERGAAGLADASERAGKSVGVHLKIDTGLNRLGVPAARLGDFIAMLAKEPRIDIEGAFSHFAFADEPANPFVDEQLARFLEALDLLAREGITPALTHIGNSAAALSRPDTHLDMVRVGISTYGLSPGPAVSGTEVLEPALSLKAEVAMVKRVPAGDGVSYGLRYRLERPGTIASLPLGYADGWARRLSGRADVLIGGRRHPAVGTVCMDSFMVDLGDDECDVGDEAVLIGSQGGERIAADEVAERSDTINYEIVTSISARVPRVYAGT